MPVNPTTIYKRCQECNEQTRHVRIGRNRPLPFECKSCGNIERGIECADCGSHSVVCGRWFNRCRACRSQKKPIVGTG